jgi:hypothetical protein
MHFRALGAPARRERANMARSRSILMQGDRDGALRRCADGGPVSPRSGFVRLRRDAARSENDLEAHTKDYFSSTGYIRGLRRN